MKISERTINLLKNYANINQSIEFHEGKTLKTVSPLNTILTSVEIEEDFPRKFPIYEVNRFLGTINLFDNPVLEFGENSVKISDGKRYAEYLYCGSSSMFQTPPEKEITFPDAEISFALETDDFKQVVNAANTLGLPEIVVEGDNKEIRLVVSDTGNVSSDIFSIKVGETDKTFRMVFKTENLTKVMEGSYDIELSSKRISKFKRKTDTLTYWIALEQNSTYEG